MLSRNTYIEINTKNYISNYLYLSHRAKTELIPVIKGNGYGCGIIEIAKLNEKLGAKITAVAFLEEAVEVREAGIKTDILIFNYLNSSYFAKAVEIGAIITVYSINQLKEYNNENRATFLSGRYHLNINTGMNNIGADFEEAEEIIKEAFLAGVKIEGVYSHFAAADGDEERTEAQYIKFMEFIKKMEAQGIFLKKIHIANSAAIINYGNRYSMDYVRCGMALYGLQPNTNRRDSNIKSVISWKSSVIKVRDLKKGERINYGDKYLSKENIRVAVIPVGYSDGYKMGNSNKGMVIIKGKKFPVIGAVCMDQITVKCDKTVLEGDEVILIGESGNVKITAEDIAFSSETIADDIICSISSKIPRIYK